MDAAAEEVETEVLIAQPLADADDAADAAAAVVDVVLLGILDEAQDEGGHAHERVGVDAADGLPL